MEKLAKELGIWWVKVTKEIRTRLYSFRQGQT
jgi:hypothetical protein